MHRFYCTVLYCAQYTLELRLFLIAGSSSSPDPQSGLSEALRQRIFDELAESTDDVECFIVENRTSPILISDSGSDREDGGVAGRRGGEGHGPAGNSPAISREDSVGSGYASPREHWFARGAAGRGLEWDSSSPELDRNGSGSDPEWNGNGHLLKKCDTAVEVGVVRSRWLKAGAAEVADPGIGGRDSDVARDRDAEQDQEQNGVGCGTEVDGHSTALDGCGAPFDGRGTEVDGHSTALDGCGAPFDGRGTEVDGHDTGCSTEVDTCGTTKVDGCGTEVDGRGTEVDGRGTEVDGRGTEVDGRGTEADGRGTEADGCGTEADGRGTEVDGNGTELDGYGAPLDGRGTELEEAPVGSHESWHLDANTSLSHEISPFVSAFDIPATTGDISKVSAACKKGKGKMGSSEGSKRKSLLGSSQLPKRKKKRHHSHSRSSHRSSSERHYSDIENHKACSSELHDSPKDRSHISKKRGRRLEQMSSSERHTNCRHGREEGRAKEVHKRHRKQRQSKVVVSISRSRGDTEGLSPSTEGKADSASHQQGEEGGGHKRHRKRSHRVIVSGSDTEGLSPSTKMNADLASPRRGEEREGSRECRKRPRKLSHRVLESMSGSDTEGLSPGAKEKADSTSSQQRNDGVKLVSSPDGTQLSSRERNFGSVVLMSPPGSVSGGSSPLPPSGADTLATHRTNADLMVTSPLRDCERSSISPPHGKVGRGLLRTSPLPPQEKVGDSSPPPSLTDSAPLKKSITRSKDVVNTFVSSQRVGTRALSPSSGGEVEKSPSSSPHQERNVGGVVLLSGDSTSTGSSESPPHLLSRSTRSERESEELESVATSSSDPCHMTPASCHVSARSAGRPDPLTCGLAVQHRTVSVRHGGKSSGLSTCSRDPLTHGKGAKGLQQHHTVFVRRGKSSELGRRDPLTSGEGAKDSLAQEAKDIEEKIRSSKRELLKSMLKKERIELLHRNLHRKPASGVQGSEAGGSERKLQEELVQLEEDIVMEKRRLLKVVKRMEEEK